MSNENFDIKVIFEDDNLLVIDKPSGISMHKDGVRDEYTVADWILEHYPCLDSVGEAWTDNKGQKIPRPGIVHRLDKDTSGVVLIAKSQNFFEYLKNQFKNREIQKEYRAFVYGGFKEEKQEGAINKAIGRSKKFGLFNVEPHIRGKAREALTEYKVLEQSGESQENDFAYLLLRPKTGRTHQIRVHLKYLHRPIICDKLYAPKKDCALGFSRLALHAYKITFNYHGKEHSFCAELPDDFKNALQELRKLKNADVFDI